MKLCIYLDSCQVRSSLSPAMPAVLPGEIFEFFWLPWLWTVLAVGAPQELLMSLTPSLISYFPPYSISIILPSQYSFSLWLMWKLWFSWKQMWERRRAWLQKLLVSQVQCLIWLYFLTNYVRTFCYVPFFLVILVYSLKYVTGCLPSLYKVLSF